MGAGYDEEDSMTTSTEQTIVVGVDGSDASVAALQWAAAQAKATGSRLRAVMTWHLPHPRYGLPFPTDQELRERTIERLRRVIDGALGPDPGISMDLEAGPGSPSAVLVDEAAGASMLVIGSTGHGGLAGSLLGSVSRHCASHSPCPTVVVRAEKQA
jgi:nucleotide-binding universal stress UspA family protein